MEKLITLRFPAKCRKCGTQIDAGSRAIWLGKGKGTQHPNCNPKREPSKPPTRDENVDRFTLDYSELREAFGLFTADPMRVYSNPANRSAGQSLREGWTADWAGITTQEMDDFIANGYHVDGLSDVQSLIPARPRRRILYGEEGDELDLSLAWSGSDTPFMDWEKRFTNPGLSVEIEMVFNAGFPAKTITQYQRWIARALQTLDENGTDMDVSLSIGEQGAWRDKPCRSETLIRVRKAGEASDFGNWSAMFSPGGFRMLGIMAIGIHGDRSGRTVSSGYGSPRNSGKFGVTYDAENNRVVITCTDSYGAQFPEYEMTEQLKSVLATLSGE